MNRKLKELVIEKAIESAESWIETCLENEVTGFRNAVSWDYDTYRIDKLDIENQLEMAVTEEETWEIWSLTFEREAARLSAERETERLAAPPYSRSRE